MTAHAAFPKPHPEQVKAAREAVQAALGLNITAAQDWCATAMSSTRRAWQQWESGDRAMHAGFWDLFHHKTAAFMPLATEPLGADIPDNRKNPP
jgi:hypothetical protein